MHIEKNARNRIFYVLLLNSVIGSLAQTVLNTALAPIMNDMNITADTAQWLTSSYTLATGIMVLSTAFLIRKYKCRTLYIVSMFCFSLGLFLAAVSPNLTVLLIGRILQAISTGVITSITQVVILSAFPSEERGSAMGIFGLAACAAPVLAPTIAGIVIDSFGWRTIFWGALALSLVTFIIGFFVMKNITQIQDAHFDILSFLLCAVGFTGIVVGLGNWGGNSFISFPVVLPIAIGIISLELFTKRQISIPKPFLQLSVFSNREFKLAVIANMLMYCGMFAASTLLPLYIQTMRGFSATISGLITMPGSLLTAITSPIAGKIYDKIGIRKLYLFGAGILLSGHIALCFLSDVTPVYLIILAFSLRQIGIGLLMMPTVTWGMSTLDSQYTSDGTALINSLRTIAGSIGSALFVSIMMAGGTDPNAMINGTNVAFGGIAILSLILLLIGIFGIKDSSKCIS